MKATYFPFIAAALAIAACANAAQSDESAAPAPTQDTVSDTYLDAPQTPGTWQYVDEPGETLAIYGAQQRREVFLLRCAGGVVSLARWTQEAQEQPRAMKVTTETVTSTLEASPVPSMERILAANLDPRDPLLDAMAITKGRFAVEIEGFEPLYLPAWTEVSRVIEDCR